MITANMDPMEVAKRAIDLEVAAFTAAIEQRRAAHPRNIRFQAFVAAIESFGAAAAFCQEEAIELVIERACAMERTHGRI